MVSLRRSFALLLCALLLAAGCSGKGKQPGPADVQHANDEVRSVIKKTVHDKDRRAQLEALVDQASRQAAEFNAANRRAVKELGTLNRTCDAMPQDFEKIAVQSRQERKTMYLALMDCLFRMRSLTDKEEWKAIVKKEKKALAVQLTAKD